MMALDRRGTSAIRDGPRQLADAMKSPRARAQLRHGCAQPRLADGGTEGQALASVIQPAILAHLRRAHTCIPFGPRGPARRDETACGADADVSALVSSRVLLCPSLANRWRSISRGCSIRPRMAALGSPWRSSVSLPFASRRRGRTRHGALRGYQCCRAAGQRWARDRRRSPAILPPGESPKRKRSGAVVLDHHRRAGALLDRVTVVAAGAGVHRRHEHEIGREGQRASGTADGDDFVLHRLPIVTISSTCLVPVLCENWRNS
jgi:hypothetical protein